MTIEFTRVTTNGIVLHVAQAGPTDGPLVLLLHGFPEFWYGWRRQIDALAAEGFRVWAPDQRGYNLSDKPHGVAAYSLDELARDVVGLINAAGAEQAFVVGHDWGAAAAWHTAITHPQRVKRLVILNVPHPVVMQRNLRSNFRQIARSWYMFMFQLPWLPERIARRQQWKPFAESLRRTARPGAFTDDDLEKYRQAWAQPGAFTAMVNWYRAIFRAPPKMPRDVRVHLPTLMLWGERDQFLGREMAQPSIDLCDNGELIFFPEATHWVQHEEPEEVNRQIFSFLRNK